MQQQFDNQIALFIRDERTGRYVFNARALKALGIDPTAIQAWMGHKNIQHVVRYTELAPDRFRDFWRD